MKSMHGVPEQFESLNDAAQFLHPRERAGIELYRAHIVRHAFEPHTHEAFGLGAIESGVERFRYAGSDHLAPAGSLVLMNPEVLHTGRAETQGGWRYRMIYIDRTVLEEATGQAGIWFPDAVRSDPARAQRVTAMLDALWCAREALAFDSVLGRLLSELCEDARAAKVPSEGRSMRFTKVIDYLHAHLAERPTLQDLAAVAGLSPFHFLRRFRTQYHVTPQQMLMALRLHDAKRRLAAGEPAAQVAVASGLADQAHLTRAFQRRYGVTPANYQRQVRS
ncbi:AraC family ligand binding domain-containing protein [Pseudoxanthomonas sp. UTMC 1351]|uniref:AraC family transcriptional regulator n=1 Tax=Pseudoxanthomonas sp. UTMC 1351 TaxID=2695853 RepID=UPI0034CDE919